MRLELSVLEGFQKISLEEIKDLAVSDRLETKFIFNIRELPQILEDLKLTHKILQVNGRTSPRYENNYFDTLDYEFYKSHHNGRANRFKIRQRRYTGSGETFLEIKQRKQNGRSVKKRIKLEADISIETQNDFLKKTLNLDAHTLFPSVSVSYERCTLIDIENHERITFDADLRVAQNEQNKIFDQLVIAELKQGNKNASLFRELMKRKGIREVPISKYCLGIASLVPGIKRNNFKPLLNSINKQIV